MLRGDLLVSLPLDLFVDYDNPLGVDCDQSPADVGVFHVPFKGEVVRGQASVTEACAGDTTTPVLKFDKRPTAGSDAGRGDGDMANLVLGTTPQGNTVYDEAAIGAVLEPGEEVVVELAVQATGTAAAGHVRPELLVALIPETKVNLINMVATE
jgi:hypothetical protein